MLSRARAEPTWPMAFPRHVGGSAANVSNTCIEINDNTLFLQVQQQVLQQCMMHQKSDL